MDGNYFDIDVIVIGGGPSGSSAAIWCALNNLKTCLIESSTFPRHKPGETLHPGISVLFEKLGIEKEVNNIAKIRHSGINTELKEIQTYTSFGDTNNNSNKGYQILRSELDDLLLNRAKQLNVKILQPCKAISTIAENGRIIGINTTKGIILGKYVIDASGNRHWLQKQLNLNLSYYSKQLLAKYGYYEGRLSNDKFITPVFKLTNNGWLWIAKISSEIYQWTHLSTIQEPKTPLVDLYFQSLKKIGATRGSDVTWRFVKECAGLGYFLTGDSCIVFDPSISRGVLRGIYSGIMASDTITKILNRKAPENISINFYRQWMQSWFNHDLKLLKDFYIQYKLDVSI